MKWKKEAAVTKGIRRREGDAFVSGKQSNRRAEYGRKIKGSHRRPSSQWGPGRCANAWLGNLEVDTEVNHWNQMRQKHVENSCIWHLPSLWENQRERNQSQLFLTLNTWGQGFEECVFKDWNWISPKFARTLQLCLRTCLWNPLEIYFWAQGFITRVRNWVEVCGRLTLDSFHVWEEGKEYF